MVKAVYKRLGVHTHIHTHINTRLCLCRHTHTHNPMYAKRTQSRCTVAVGSDSAIGQQIVW